MEAGDLGRRVRERREDRGLSREDAANSAGMAPTYLRYLEESPRAAPPVAALHRLATLLETTVDALRGSGFSRPVGSDAHRAGSPRLDVLDDGTCLDLIRPGGVGRVVIDDETGPIALPVNYVTVDDDVVFQTGDGAIGAAVAAGRPLSVEIDHFDDTLAEGWSVLLRGHATIGTVPARGGSGGVPEIEIESWAGAPRSTTVRLHPVQITGCQIRRFL